MKIWMILFAGAVLLLQPQAARADFDLVDSHHRFAATPWDREPVFPGNAGFPTGAVPTGNSMLRQSRFIVSPGPKPEQTLTVPLPQGPEPVRQSFARLPLSFVRNDGQANPATKFEVRGRGYLLSLEQTEAVMLLASPANEDAERLKTRPSYETVEPWIEGTIRPWLGSGISEKAAEDRRTPKPGGESTRTLHFLRMAMVGANPNARMTGEDELPGKFHYFIGNDPALWRTNVPSFAKVRYREVYPGIDLVYYGNEGQLEYDFVVGPGADPSQIALAIEGADTIEVDDKGDLRLEVAGRELFWRKPVLYQEKDGVRLPVAGEFVLLPTAPSNDGVPARQVAFRVASYDRMLALVIDPVLAYSTYLGGGIADAAYGVAVDPAGCVYVTGQTFSRSTYNSNPAPGNPFPTTTNAVKHTFSVIGAAFVTKFSTEEERVLYSTVLCGNSPSSQSTIANAIQVDGLGQAVITGNTDASDFPRKNALQPRYGGGYSDAFVAKLTPEGSSLVFSTFLGGSKEESQGNMQGLGLDAAFNIYVAGKTTTSDFPVEQPFQAMLDTSHGAEDAFQDAFLVKLAEPLPHSVEITRAGSTIMISWPVSATGFTLESTGSLAPAPNWQPELTEPEVVGSENRVRLEIEGNTKFFRLRKP
ncbi:MAG TPA: hypothetical protein P5186_05665 [Candidatus Paceibacterota bacterium]|nr:hypothetical protein [Verrucomicrobiota bacterium]HRY47515.1 hypothetical protein [Candidatus Paceibacterota bacterium]HSA02133.1 hypothetical protein [Candidatus Paceibacterota bacterium]